MKAIQKIKSNLSKIIKVLRHGILSLYSYIRKFVPWRSRTSTSPSNLSSLSSSSSSSISSYIRSLRNIRIAGLSSSFLLGLLALAIIIPLYNVTGTEDTEAATSYNEASITLTSSSTTATITADAATLGSSGTAFISSNLSTSSQYASYSITTTNATGYTIGIATNTSSTSTNLTSGTNTLSSLAYNNTTKNGLSSSSYNTATYNNTWALYPGTVGNSANSKFYPISNNTITMGTTSEANDTDNTYKVGLAARITMNQASGTYTTTAGNFKVTAVGNPAAYAIAYNANGGSGAPATQASTSHTQQSVALSSTTPTRSNYNFLGWCTVATSDQASGTSGSTACANAGGTYYAAGGTFYIDETTKNVTTLYAVWELAGYTITFATSNATGIVFNGTTYTNGQSVTIPEGTYSIYGTYATKYAWQSWSATAGTFGNQSYQYTTYTVTGPATITLAGQSVTLAMQNLSSSNCTTTARPVYDIRDNTVYWVQQLADGECWMLDNLALDLVSTKSTLSSSNTNATDTELGYLKGISTGTTSDKYATAAITNWTSTDSYSAPLQSLTDKDKTVTSYGSGSGKVGGYYNYCAASAGTYCYGDGTSTGTSSGNATADICPAGWQMPSTTSSNNVAGSYYYLYNTAYSANATDFRNALSTPLSGYFSNGSAGSQGSDGYFWSSTRSNNYFMYGLYVNSSNVRPTDYYDRNYGYSVRCVLTPPPTLYETIASMSKGNFDMSTINTSLTTANSGVYKYTGSHSDNGTSDIYFYRGIIDSSFTNSSAGSSGDGTLYPNYVKLITKVGSTTYNTCWRIFRTTASGGVKMIYNGLWTGSTCANATTSAQLSSTAYYNRGNPSTSGSDYYGTKGFIAYVGYNYNNTYAYNNTSYTSAIANDTLFTNSTASNIRTKVENWYTRTLGTATNSLLESSAGYCNDRSTYDTNNTETTTTIPYAPSTQTNFGARDRNYVNTSPSLACPYPSRDLLTTSKGLGYPVALITLDEAVLAGNGYYNKEAYAATSYLTSGSDFWSLSPFARYSSGYVYVALVHSDGYAGSFDVYRTYGVRPVISLTSGTTPESGSGTATDPWVVE